MFVHFALSASESQRSFLTEKKKKQKPHPIYRDDIINTPYHNIITQTKEQ